MERRQHVGRYGVSGWKWACDVAEYARRIGAFTILDYGAGKGTLADTLGNVAVANYDPVTFPGDPPAADLVVCTDVLEFVESRSEVLAHIKSLARKGVFIAVPKHPWSKQREGLTIRSLEWWERQLAKYWTDYEADVVEFSGDVVIPYQGGNATPRLRFRA